MNILPLILSLLMVLSMATYALMQSTKATYWEERSYAGFMEAARKLRSEWEKNAYKQMPKKTAPHSAPAKKPDKTPVSNESSEKEGSYQNPREKKPYAEFAKLNLAPLLQKPAPSFKHKIYETAAKLIRALYQDLSFFKNSKIENLEYRLLDAMLENEPAQADRMSLAELFPNDPQLKNIYYQMLKGTKSYELERHEGIPSLKDFFFIDCNAKSKPIFFAHASIPLLTALLGPKGCALVLQEERKKWEQDSKHHTLTKPELESALSQERLNLAELEDVLNFNKSTASSKTLIGLDQTTGILLDKHI